jgi:hypothetical protein
MLAQGGDIRNIENLDICPTFSQFMFEGVPPRVEVPADHESEESLSSDDFPQDLDFSTTSDASYVNTSTVWKLTVLSFFLSFFGSPSLFSTFLFSF